MIAGGVRGPAVMGLGGGAQAGGELAGAREERGGRAGGGVGWDWEACASLGPRAPPY
jgi:hypothetical protein